MSENKISGHVKKITVLVCAFNKTDGTISGGDVYSKELTKTLLSFGHNLDWVSNKFGCNFSADLGDKLSRYCFPTWFDQFPLTVSYLFRTFVTLTIILRQRPDIVISSSDFFPDVIPAFLLKLLVPKIKWVQFVHHLYPSWRERKGGRIINFFTQQAQRFSLSMAQKSDETIVINKLVESELVLKGFRGNQIKLIPPGINLEIVEKGSKRNLWPLDFNSTTCTFVGRLHQTKGVFDLPKIFFDVKSQIPDATLSIIGNGPSETKQELLRLIKNLELEGSVFLRTNINDLKKIQLLTASDVFIFPSYEEGYGISILEALACGCEVISWDLESYALNFPEQLNIVETGNLNLMAEEVVKIIKNKKSNKISNHRKKFVEERSMHSNMADLAKHIIKRVNI